MKNWAYFIAAHALAFGVSGSANAADMFSMDDVCGSWKDAPCEQPALWSGIYVGGFVGGGSGDTDITDVFDYNGDPIAKNSISVSPFVAGVNIGYNNQNGNFVYGLEAALGTMNLSGSVSVDDLEPDGNDAMPIGAKYSISGGLYGELTGRVGYARENLLLYLKGGAAFVNANLDAHYSGDNWCTDPRVNDKCVSDQSYFDFGKDDVLLGWTLGLGLEYALSDKWSLKAEYQHFDFGNISYNYSGSYMFREDYCRGGDCYSNLSGDVDADLTVDLVKIGVNYKLQD